jgi:hypothetical protein
MLHTITPDQIVQIVQALTVLVTAIIGIVKLLPWAHQATHAKELETIQNACSLAVSATEQYKKMSLQTGGTPSTVELAQYALNEAQKLVPPGTDVGKLVTTLEGLLNMKNGSMLTIAGALPIPAPSATPAPAAASDITPDDTTDQVDVPAGSNI